VILVAGVVVAGLLQDPRPALVATVVVWAVVFPLAFPLLDLGLADYQDLTQAHATPSARARQDLLGPRGELPPRLAAAQRPAA
jgi:hypothetical protein